MRKPIFKTSLMIVGLMAAIVACDPEQDQGLAPQESQPYEGAPTVDKTAESFIVANIQKDGHEFRFIAVGEDVDIIEKMPDSKAGQLSFLEQHEGSTAMEIFLSVTDSHVAVPAVIANTADGNLASQRKIDYSNALVEISDGSVSEVITEACGDPGADAFYNLRCEPPVVSNANNIEFCDNGLWNSLIRNSVFGGAWQNVSKVTTRTRVVCGVTRIGFHYWSSGQWVLYHQVDFQSGIWIWNRNISSARYQRVTRSRLNGVGSFRAFTRFYN